MASEHERDDTLVDVLDDTLVEYDGQASVTKDHGSFVRMSGARASITDAFNLQDDFPPATSTPTKQRRTARKIERLVRHHDIADELERTHFSYDSASTGPSRLSDAYLAYPHLKTISRHNTPVDNDTHSFIIVEDDDGRVLVDLHEPEHPAITSSTPLARMSPIPQSLSSALPRLKNRLSQAFLRSSSPHDTITSHQHNVTPASSHSPACAPSSSRSSTPLFSYFSDLQHSRTNQNTPEPPSQRYDSPDSNWTGLESNTLRSSRTWAKKVPRASVLGYFSSTSLTSSEASLPSTTPGPRPSLSSSRSHMSTSRTSSSIVAADAGGRKFLSVRTALSLQAPSLWSLRSSDASAAEMRPDSNQSAENTTRAPGITSIPQETAPSRFAKATAFLRPPNAKRKRKMVVSGIKSGDLRREQALRKWCSSQGEVSRLVRVANGNIHVSYRSAEVAEEVCCIRGRVIIDGVGTVNLSWFRGTP